MQNRQFGNLGESYAVRLLQKAGYKILDRNVRSKAGEIDIVAVVADTLVFVEVKTRSSTVFGVPEEAVNQAKLNRIKRAGEYYFLTHKDLPKKQRVDVVAIQTNNGAVVSAKIIKVF